MNSGEHLAASESAPLPGHIVVTGAASGIGFAAAALLVHEGWKVALVDRDEAGLEKARAQLGKREGVVRAMHADITNEASVEAALKAGEDDLGPIIGLVNSAGIARDVPFLETTPELFRTIFDVNVVGSFIVARCAAQAMIRTGTPGSIVNLASVSGLRGNLGRSAYGASKGAVVTLTKVMAVELAAHKIRVNAVAPGPVDTPMVKAMHGAEVRSLWMQVVPQRRYAEPAEIAHAIAFLLDNEKSSFITGQVLAVDGGFDAAGLMTHG